MFYNDLFAFDMDRRRWFHLALKKANKKKTKDRGKGTQGGGGAGGSALVRRDAVMVLKFIGCMEGLCVVVTRIMCYVLMA